MERISRPIGVIVIAVLLLLSGLSALVALFPAVTGLTTTPLGVFLNVIFAAVMFYLAWGLFTLKPWAWLSTLIIQGINAFYAIMEIVRAPRSIVGWLGILIAAVVIIYLTRPHVRKLFGQTHRVV